MTTIDAPDPQTTGADSDSDSATARPRRTGISHLPAHRARPPRCTRPT